MALYPNGATECFNEQDTEISLNEIEENTGVSLDNIVKWNSKIKNKVQKAREKNPEMIFNYVRNNNIEGVKRLIQAGADVDIQDNYGETPLFIASNKGYLEIVQILIQAGADVDKQDEFVFTPLMIASKKGHTEIVKLLIKAGADVDKGNKTIGTPLMIASKKGHTEIVELLKQTKNF